MDKYIDVHCEGIDEFEVFDLDGLLERYYEDGFTLDSLNLILWTDIDDVSACSLEDQEKMLDFLSFLYAQKVNENDYPYFIYHLFQFLFIQRFGFKSERYKDMGFLL